VTRRPAADFGRLIVPTLTPLTPDEQLDEAAFERHLTYLMDAGADSIFILGSNGEGAMLRSATRMAVATAALRIVNGRVPVLSGVLEISTARVVDELSAMRGLGLSGYVITAPLYFDNYPAADLVRHFAAAAAKADAPVVAYSIPRFANWFTADLIGRLARIPNVAGLKDSSGNWAGFQALLLERPGDDFALYQGDHAFCAVSLFAGCDGIVPGYANLYPTLFVKLLAAASSSRWDEALGLQRDLNQLMRARGTGGLHATKLIAQALGLMDDYVTTPLPRIDEDALQRLLRASDRAGLEPAHGGRERGASSGAKSAPEARLPATADA
jgi:4-hydroxy-tetrahydrodipicolinate synthase